MRFARWLWLLVILALLRVQETAAEEEEKEEAETDPEDTEEGDDDDEEDYTDYLYEFDADPVIDYIVDKDNPQYLDPERPAPPCQQVGHLRTVPVPERGQSEQHVVPAVALAPE